MESKLYYSDYRQYLTEGFETRASRNARYSLRAYARDLGLAVSTLNELLSGKYGLSKDRALLVGKKLNLNERQSAHFADLFKMKHARNEIERRQARQQVQERLNQSVSSLTVDAFKTISEWHHLTLLELLELNQFKDEPSWYAQRLGLSEIIIAESFKRLARLNMVVIQNGKIKPTDEYTAIGNDLPSEAIRKFHKQILEKAVTALDCQLVEEREFSSTVMGISREDLPAAKKALQTFRREFSTKFSKKNKNDVFCLGMQFFSLIEKGKSK